MHTSEATAFTGVSLMCPNSRMSSSSGVPRVAYALGRLSQVNTTTRSMADMGGCGCETDAPPQKLVGVGFSSQGKFEATYYRKTDAGKHPDYAWIFDGVEGDILGDYGLSGGGAAGYEMDRADETLGTPENAVVLARSENSPPSAVHVNEDMLGTVRTVNGEPVSTMIRADMVYFKTPSGGAVFSVGSMTFLGSLWRNGFEGPISRLLQNVVARFSAPAPSGDQPELGVGSRSQDPNEG